MLPWVTSLFPLFPVIFHYLTSLLSLTTPPTDRPNLRPLANQQSVKTPGSHPHSARFFPVIPACRTLQRFSAWCPGSDPVRFWPPLRPSALDTPPTLCRRPTLASHSLVNWPAFRPRPRERSLGNTPTNLLFSTKTVWLTVWLCWAWSLTHCARTTYKPTYVLYARRETGYARCKTVLLWKRSPHPPPATWPVARCRLPPVTTTTSGQQTCCSWK